MIVGNAAQKQKTVADPLAEYETLKPLWDRSRAVCGGERYVKAYDAVIDVTRFTNILIPFSRSMTQDQYNLFKAEAELPGVVAQFSKMLVGGLLRKQPVLTLPKVFGDEGKNWLMNDFGEDGRSMVAFMDEALTEELKTSRAWVYVDYPRVTNPDALTPEQAAAIKPYPVLWRAEHVINWRVSKDPATGLSKLVLVVTRGYEEQPPKNELDFHPDLVDTVRVHELTAEGLYQVRVFQAKAPTNSAPVINGQAQTPTSKANYELVETITNFMVHGKRLDIIPAWPLNGGVDLVEPILTPLVDKECTLYNKISRRNHLMYGAATYTPYVAGDITNEQFEEIVEAGLGSWLHFPSGCVVDILKPPTEALKDMEATIAAGFEEMARLGVRMLTPEVEQSGVALEIRNAAQNAQIGTLNTKISDTMKQVVVLMLMWRYDKEFDANDVQYTLSEDFNPVPLGADWLRLATEWYQQGLIPRSVWLTMLKQNDMVPPDYNDEEGQQEITAEQDLQVQRSNDQYADQLKLETAAQAKLSKAQPPK